MLRAVSQWHDNKWIYIGYHSINQIGRSQNLDTFLWNLPTKYQAHHDNIHRAKKHSLCISYNRACIQHDHYWFSNTKMWQAFHRSTAIEILLKLHTHIPKIYIYTPLSRPKNRSTEHLLDFDMNSLIYIYFSLNTETCWSSMQYSFFRKAVLIYNEFFWCITRYICIAS